MPLAEMSAHVLRVGFFQGLGNGDLTEVFLLRFHGRQNGISQATGRHPMEQAVPGGSAQSGRRITGRQDHAFMGQPFEVRSLIEITSGIGATLYHFNRGFGPTEIIHVHQNEIGTLTEGDQ